MKTTSVRGCPICKQSPCEVLHTQRFVLPEGCPLPAEYDVVVCSSCGFVFADTSASQEAYNEFYSFFSKYTDNSTASGGGGSPSDSERLQAAADRIRSVFKHPSARIVDIGCANGGLLSALKEQGFVNLFGVDPSLACANFTRQKYGIATVAATLDHLPSEIGQFDGVVLSHVLEHVLDLKRALGCVRMILKSEGTLYVEVPDGTKYRELVVAPFQDFNTEHINHFSHSSLKNLADATGFRVNTHGDVTLETSPGMTYPAIFQAWELTAVPQHSLVHDLTLREDIEQYIHKSQELISRMEKQLKSEIQPNEPLLIWGTGQLAMKLLAETSLRSANIVAFVDSNPIHHGEKILGHLVLPPRQIQNMPYPILIASTLHATAISRQIENELGMRNRLILLSYASTPEPIR